MKYFLTFFLLLWPVSGAFGVPQAPPPTVFRETVFKVEDGRVIAPRAKHAGSAPVKSPEGYPPGWTSTGAGDYYSFDAGEVLDIGQGTIEAELVLVDRASLSERLESILTFYDASGVPFFSIGLNDHDVAVGSFRLHPMAMEDAFGGTGFPYLYLLKGPLKEGDRLNIKVTWGPLPSEGRVYVNGTLIPVEKRKGPKGRAKPPGFEPTKTFGSYLGGFEYNGKAVGAVKSVIIGQKEMPDPRGKLMYPPKAFGIKSVSISNLPENPETE